MSACVLFVRFIAVTLYVLCKLIRFCYTDRKHPNYNTPDKQALTVAQRFFLLTSGCQVSRAEFPIKYAVFPVCTTKLIARQKADQHIALPVEKRNRVDRKMVRTAGGFLYHPHRLPQSLGFLGRIVELSELVVCSLEVRDVRFHNRGVQGVEVAENEPSVVGKDFEESTMQ